MHTVKGLGQISYSLLALVDLMSEHSLDTHVADSRAELRYEIRRAYR